MHLLVLQRVLELLGVLGARPGSSAAQGGAGADGVGLTSVALFPFPVLQQRHLDSREGKASETRPLQKTRVTPMLGC